MTAGDETAADLGDRLSRLEARLAAAEAAAAAQANWQAELRADARRSLAAATEALAAAAQVSTAAAGHGDWLRDLQQWVNSCVKTLSALGSQPLPGPDPASSGTLDPLATLSARIQVATVMDWIAHTGTVAPGPLVSVTIATRNRPDQIRGAVRSVLEQSYPHLELIVVDDSDDDATAHVLTAIDDERLRTVRHDDHRGAAAAFNAGIDAVGGDIVAFLDDDNLMHHDWLRSVVWAFDTFPAADAVYGARTVEDPAAQGGVRSGMLPEVEFAFYDRSRHELANYVDRNTIAFRAHLAVVRYDESLRAAVDWDHSLRLFATAPPIALPALACYYRTAIAGRIGDEPDRQESVLRVASRTHTTRPLRVLVHTAMYPVVSETYIGEDIDALRACGAEVAVTSVQPAASVAAGADPVRLDVDAVIGEHRPDVALLHWMTHASGSLAVLEAHDLPFVCRLHSFDIDPGLVRQVQAHPLCVALIADPVRAKKLGLGMVPLAPIIGPTTVLPPADGRRDLIVSASAGVPKKDFPLLIEAMAGVPEWDRHIILSRSNGFGDLPGDVTRRAAAADRDIHVRVNVDRSDVLAALARAHVAIYTLAPDEHMGYPMSIIEAMLCGALVIAPDVPEAHEIVGEHLLTYRSAADIVAHIRATAAGGPEIDEARAALAARAERHRHPDERLRLHQVLSDELTAWRYRRLAGGDPRPTGR